MSFRAAQGTNLPGDLGRSVGTLDLAMCSGHLPYTYLGSQQPCQVDLRDHLAATVTFTLVQVIVVLYQVPQFCSTFQVWRDHGCS